MPLHLPLTQSGPLHWPSVTMGHGPLVLVGFGPPVTVVDVADASLEAPFGHHAGDGGQVIAGPELLAGDGAT